MRNKFVEVKNLFSRNLDIRVISERKLDDSFATKQFIINGFSNPCRLDRNQFGGGLILYIKNNIPSKRLSSHILINDIECLCLQINLRTKCWLLCYVYDPHKRNYELFFTSISTWKTMKDMRTL